jgi:hypothetical protein
VGEGIAEFRDDGEGQFGWKVVKHECHGLVGICGQPPAEICCEFCGRQFRDSAGGDELAQLCGDGAP